ncbi:MAG: hypothetical protein CL685_03195 [Candidatus Magasanikbacteria bacterium]|nr:hypothetical protein [Candidatus Magasanikbacteria bacterium]|tara:strand:+ start:1070 stop:1477 length:408 start_codon:yes stop_codon:yes gene_type:complete
MKEKNASNTLLPHHIYQLKLIFLFVLGFFLFVFLWHIAAENNANMYLYQWWYFWIWESFYVIYLLKVRNTIPKKERINPKKRPIIYWVILGITLVALSQSSFSVERFLALDYSFIIFSLFLADSYWDFTQTITKT